MKNSLYLRAREYALAKFLIPAGLAALIPLPAAATERTCYPGYASYAAAAAACRAWLEQGICDDDPDPPPSDGIIVSIEGRNNGWNCCCVSLLVALQSEPDDLSAAPEGAESLQSEEGDLSEE